LGIQAVTPIVMGYVKKKICVKEMARVRVIRNLNTRKGV
jgi:hypothetical protein